MSKRIEKNRRKLADLKSIQNKIENLQLEMRRTYSTSSRAMKIEEEIDNLYDREKELLKGTDIQSVYEYTPFLEYNGYAVENEREDIF